MARSRLPLVFLAVTSLAGCGQLDGLMAATTPATFDSQAAANGEPWAAGHPGARQGRLPMGKGGPGLPFAGLSLSDEQQAQIKTIMDTYRPQAMPDDAGRKAEKALRDALAAETFDEAAVRAALQARQDAMAAHRPPSPAAMLTEVRAVLTADQVDVLVNRLQAAPEQSEGDRPEPPGGRPGLKPGLDLSDVQQAALTAFHDQMKASHDAVKPADRRQAEISFWQTGDASALDALRPTPPAFPVDAFVAAAQVLDPSQRQLLLGPGAPGHGGHGGPLGPGIGAPGRFLGGMDQRGPGGRPFGGMKPGDHPFGSL